MKEAVKTLSNIYTEKRSDVSDLCEDILNNIPPDPNKAEHRYVRFIYNNTEFLYDTLTTLVEVNTPEGWKTIEGIEYYD